MLRRAETDRSRSSKAGGGDEMAAIHVRHCARWVLADNAGMVYGNSGFSSTRFHP
jgi:hypothetical protein